MAKETSILQVRLSPKLKAQLKAMGDQREMDISSMVRDLLTNAVRTYERQNGKLPVDEV